MELDLKNRTYTTANPDIIVFRICPNKEDRNKTVEQVFAGNEHEVSEYINKNIPAQITARFWVYDSYLGDKSVISAKVWNTRYITEVMIEKSSRIFASQAQRGDDSIYIERDPDFDVFGLGSGK